MRGKRRSFAVAASLAVAGGAAFLCWRLWNKERPKQEEATPVENRRPSANAAQEEKRQEDEGVFLEESEAIPAVNIVVEPQDEPAAVEATPELSAPPCLGNVQTMAVQSSASKAENHNLPRSHSTPVVGESRVCWASLTRAGETRAHVVPAPSRMPTEGPVFYLSHSGDVEAQVKAVAQRLWKGGYSCFFEPRETLMVKLGSWKRLKTIQTNLYGCHICVVVITPVLLSHVRNQRAEWACMELHTAMVRLQDAKPAALVLLLCGVNEEEVCSELGMFGRQVLDCAEAVLELSDHEEGDSEAFNFLVQIAQKHSCEPEFAP